MAASRTVRISLPSSFSRCFSASSGDGALPVACFPCTAG